MNFRIIVFLVSVLTPEPTCFTSNSLPQLGFEINCGNDNNCVDDLKVDFNFTK